MLIGDGDRLPRDDGQLLGSAGATAKGVGLWYPKFSLASGARFGAIGGRVFSLCNSLDIVCDHRPGLHNAATPSGRVAMSVGTAVHMSYRVGPQLGELGAKVAAKLRKDAMTVYRTSGRAGFVSYATGFTCPAVSSGYVLVVTRGAGQAPGEAFTDPYDEFSNGAWIVSSADAGQVLTVTDGGGCGAYPTPAQAVEVSVYDAIRGGKPVVEGTAAAVTAAGRWDAVRLVLPAGSGASGWHVTATCRAADGDSPDQSYQPYPTVTIAAG